MDCVTTQKSNLSRRPEKTSDMHTLFHPFEIIQSGNYVTRTDTVSTQGSKALFLLFELV